MKKLHLGVGKCYLPGWTNVDISNTIRADVYDNALSLPYDRESFDLIYASHCLTFWRSEAETPNFSWIASAFFLLTFAFNYGYYAFTWTL